MKPSTRLVLGAVAALALASACGGDDDSAGTTTIAVTTASNAVAPTTPTAPSTTAASATTAASTTSAPPATTSAPATTASPATTTPRAGDLPETPVIAPIEQAYAFDGTAPDPALLPAQPGEVTARWYRSGAVYAVVYDGLAADAPACPGNSAQTTAGFDFVSNAAVPGMSCDGFSTLIESTDAQGVQICGDRVSYLTLIPADHVAVLYSSIERPTDGGGGVGVTGFVLVEDPTILPEIDPASLRC